jgi:hypothetical protein
MPPCHWITQRFWDGQGWRERPCESAASIKLGLPALLFDIFQRLILPMNIGTTGPIGL